MIKASKKILILKTVLLSSVCALLAGCDYVATSPNRTEVPLYIAPLSSSGNPKPTPTPDYASLIETGPEEVVGESGYAFAPVTIWEQGSQPLVITINSEQTSLSDDAGLVYRISNDRNSDIQDVQGCLQANLDRQEGKGLAFYPFSPVPATLPVGEGLKVDFEGTLMGFAARGSLIAVQTDRGCLSLFGAANNQYRDQQHLWETSGQAVFDRLAQSLRYLEHDELPTCLAAPNDSYGLNPDFPIPVGNTNLYDGKDREELYLLTLRGPNGEEIFFKRQNPMFNKDGEIVDPYKTWWDEFHIPITLYFTIYRFEAPLYSPVGFTCEAVFPLNDPGN